MLLERGSPEARLERLQVRCQGDLALQAYEHDQRAETIVDEHERALNALAHGGSTDVGDLRIALRLSNLAFSKSVSNTESQLGDFLADAEYQFTQALPAGDKGLWSSVFAEAAYRGNTHHRAVVSGLDYASSPQAKKAMRSALDREVWGWIHIDAKNSGVDTPQVINDFHSASNDSARDAMKAALDNTVWRQVSNQAEEEGVDHFSVWDSLEFASSDSVRAAMRVALDRIVWLQVSERGPKVIEAVSSPIARDSMHRFVDQRMYSY